MGSKSKIQLKHIGLSNQSTLQQVCQCIFNPTRPRAKNQVSHGADAKAEVNVLVSGEYFITPREAGGI